jgi:GNAT superfamily N-acetyltransferase
LLKHRTATLDDVSLLASLNRQLIEDEDHRNPMTLPELEDRMQRWLSGSYAATLFSENDVPVAYALWRDRPDWIDLRHFFVDRSARREGVGRQAMQILTNEVWPPEKRVRVEVLTANVGGVAFWRAVGFSDYALTLELDRGT